MLLDLHFPPTPNSTVLPPHNLVERKHILIAIYPLQQLHAIPHPTTNISPTPNAKVHPIRLIRFQHLRFHDGADFCRSDDFGIIRKSQEIIVRRGNRTVVALRVSVRGHDIYDVVAWIPDRGDGVPDPDQIVEFVVVC